MVEKAIIVYNWKGYIYNGGKGNYSKQSLHMDNRYRTNTNIKWGMNSILCFSHGLGAITEYLVTD